MEENKKNIVNHISRLEGQLASVKKEMQKSEPDCVKASKTLLSASRSFAGLRENFVESFLLKYFVTTKNVRDREIFNQLLTLIKG